jgi:hypothetical protein
MDSDRVVMDTLNKNKAYRLSLSTVSLKTGEKIIGEVAKRTRTFVTINRYSVSLTTNGGYLVDNPRILIGITTVRTDDVIKIEQNAEPII